MPTVADAGQMFPPADDFCAGIRVHGGHTVGPRRVLFLVDRSSGMSSVVDIEATAWELMGQLVIGFVEAAAPFDIELALDYFPAQTSSVVLSDGGAQPSCDPPSDAPAVGFAPATDNASPILASLGAESPSGSRALAPAFEASLQALELGAPDPSAQSIVLFTNGLPDACQPRALDELTALALLSGTRVYLVGFGPGLDALRAEASAFDGSVFVDGDDLSLAREAFEGWFGLAPTCDIGLPAPPLGEEYDPDAIRVEITFASSPEVVERLSDVASCQLNRDEGWYLDHEGTSIRFCPATCERALGATIDVSLICS